MCDPNVRKEDCPDCQKAEEEYAEFVANLGEPVCEFCGGECQK